MNASRFDALVKNLETRLSRRRLLAGAVVAGSIGSMRVANAAAICVPVGSLLTTRCTTDTAGQCCSGMCFNETGICCQPSGAANSGTCGIDAYGCCSGLCDPERQVCCVAEGSYCESNSECCGYVETPVVGKAYAYCSSESWTCQYAVVSPPPPAGTDRPSPANIADGAPPQSHADGPLSDSSSWISQLSAARSNVEMLVHALKQNLNATDPLLLAAQLDYGTTKATFDGWIDGFKYNIAHGTNETTTLEAFQGELKDGLALADHFSSTYRSALSVSGGGASQQSPVQAPMPTGVALSGDDVIGGGPVLTTVLTMLIQNLPTIVEQSLSVYNSYQSGQDEERTRILADLESLRWKSWADIA